MRIHSLFLFTDLVLLRRGNLYSPNYFFVKKLYIIYGRLISKIERLDYRNGGRTMKKIGTIMLATFVSCVMVISGIAASGKNVYAADGDEVTVLETDQSEPREGNVFVEVEGKFTSQDIAKAVERINEIREEACGEGLAYPNPNNKEQSSTKKLSETDYHALTWSQGMEIWANVRAAELSIAVGHVRMNSFNEHTYNMPEINGTIARETMSAGI